MQLEVLQLVEKLFYYLCVCFVLLLLVQLGEEEELHRDVLGLARDVFRLHLLSEESVQRVVAEPVEAFEELIRHHRVAMLRLEMLPDNSQQCSELGGILVEGNDDER